jgi:plastocyanin
MRARPLLVCLGVLAALAFAGQASAANYTVWAGPGFLKAAPAGTPKSADANLFFPRRLEVHVGDKVTFKSDGFHTATYLGTHKGAEFPIFTPAPDKSAYSGIADFAGSPFYFNAPPKFSYNVPQVFAPTGSNVISGGGDVHSSGGSRQEGLYVQVHQARRLRVPLPHPFHDERARRGQAEDRACPVGGPRAQGDGCRAQLGCRYGEAARQGCPAGEHGVCRRR